MTRVKVYYFVYGDFIQALVMASITSATQQATQSGLADLRVAQAQRNAVQAEQTARALQQQAAGARREANRAQENARSLSVQSSQAQDDAGRARQGVAALQSQVDNLSNLSQRLDTLAPQAVTPAAEVAAVSQAAPSPAAAPAANAPAPVVNTDGQVTGTLINITA
jgi:hypothetical protein